MGVIVCPLPTDPEWERHTAASVTSSSLLKVSTAVLNEGARAPEWQLGRAAKAEQAEPQVVEDTTGNNDQSVLQAGLLLANSFKWKTADSFQIHSVIGKNVITMSVRTSYYIIGQVITFLGFVTCSVKLSANFITFQALLHFQEIWHYWVVQLLSCRSHSWSDETALVVLWVLTEQAVEACTPHITVMLSTASVYPWKS